MPSRKRSIREQVEDGFELDLLPPFRPSPTITILTMVVFAVVVVLWGLLGRRGSSLVLLGASVPLWMWGWMRYRETRRRVERQRRERTHERLQRLEDRSRADEAGPDDVGPDVGA